MTPVRTAVVDHHEIDAAGVSAVLHRYRERILLVGADAPDVDVLLYGARELHPGHDDELHLLLRSTPATVIVLGWGPDTPQVAWALSCGADGLLSKTMSGDDLVAGVEQLVRVRDRGPRPLPVSGECHPALRTVGLTPRELEVLALITQGLTNQEIADRAYISINSVKTYVRTAYRKIEVTRRSQAVSWGLRAGLAHELEAQDPSESPSPRQPELSR